MFETGHGPVQLYYDSGCGPCTFFARACRGLSHSRLAILPLNSAEARRELADLSEDDRFASAHMIAPGGRRTGPEIVGPLVGVTLGPTAERVVRGAAPMRGGLRWLYGLFWEYRRSKGCAAATADGRSR